MLLARAVGWRPREVPGIPWALAAHLRYKGVAQMETNYYWSLPGPMVVRPSEVTDLVCEGAGGRSPPVTRLYSRL